LAFLDWVRSKQYASFDARDIQLFLLSYDRSSPQLLDAAMQFKLLNAEAYGAIARRYVEISEFEKALEAYAQAARLAPDQGIWPLASASIYERMGNSAEARQSYLKATNLDPNQPGYLAAYADFLRRTGDFRLAITYYDLAIEAWYRSYPGIDTSGFVAGWQRQIESLSPTSMY
jgi:tetratricopeptide (TPR) repeat protein